MITNIPKGALNIIELLHKSKFEAYLVGGCVRDMLLGKEPNDWDICTNATPTEVKKMADTYGIGTFDTGIEFGTVSLIMGGKPYEVTTYRADSDKSDGRKPEKVVYVKTLKEDIVRRDLTINALAYDIHNNQIIDYVNGLEDLRIRRIRFVGNIETRIREDYLRALRAIRFKITYGFSMSNNDLLTCVNYFISNYTKLSNERIHSEVDKMLIACRSTEDMEILYRLLANTVIPELNLTYTCEQNNPYHKHNVAYHIMSVTLYVKPTLELRWAALLHDIGKPLVKTTNETGDHFIGHSEESAKIAKDVLYRLHYNKDFINLVVKLVNEHDSFNQDSKLSAIRRFMGKNGEDFMINLLHLKIADRKDHTNAGCVQENIIMLQQQVERVISEKSDFNLKTLKINGNDLKQMGLTDGKQIGVILKYLLDNCYGCPELNNREWLLKEGRKQVNKHLRQMKATKRALY